MKKLFLLGFGICLLTFSGWAVMSIKAQSFPQPVPKISFEGWRVEKGEIILTWSRQYIVDAATLAHMRQELAQKNIDFLCATGLGQKTRYEVHFGFTRRPTVYIGP